MAQEPGWYHAEGDPAGTVRWWDGAQWSGDPVTQPTGGAPGTPTPPAAPMGMSTTTPSGPQDFASSPATTPGMGMSGFGGGGELATFGQRVGAWAIDTFGVMLALFVPMWIVAFIIGIVSDTLGSIVFFLGMIAVVVVAYYIVGWLQGVTGQSPGKRMMGIETVKADTGSYIGGGMGIARLLLGFINSLPCYIGWLWPLFDDQNRTFVDMILGTRVQQTNRPKDILPIFPDGKPF